MLIALLPFGAGQLQNQSYLLGLAFAGLEGGALFYWYSENQAANKTITDTNNYISAKKQQSPDGALTEEDAAFAQARAKYVKTRQGNATNGLIGFGVLWAIGATEALINDPPPPPKKKTRKRRFGGFAWQDEAEATTSADASRLGIPEGLSDEGARLLPQWRYGLHLAPAFDRDLSQSAIPLELGLGFSVDF